MIPIRDMVAIMNAAAEGDKIEEYCFTSPELGWMEVKHPTWNWNNFNYRVKAKPIYRPYKNAEECAKDFIKHGGLVKSYRGHLTITKIDEYGVYFYGRQTGEIIVSFDNFLSEFIWADDAAHCGIKED